MFDSYITSNKTDSSSKEEVKAKSFKVNDSNWSIKFEGCSPSEADVINSVSNDGTYGLKIGSTTKYCTSMVFESDYIENINKIYFKGATAASTNESITFVVFDEDDNIVIFQKKLILKL